MTAFTIAKQVFGSLFNVSCIDFKRDLQYKMITFLNLTKKGIIPNLLGFTPALTKSRFDDCILKVGFNDLTFFFFCPRGRTFHIYMNPYFHEYDVSTFIYNVLKKGDTFIDIGAMGGLYSLIASKIVGNLGKVISIEPHQDNLHVLQSNMKLNNLHNITIVNKAIGEKNSKIALYYDEESTESTSAFKGERKESFDIEMVTLDSIMGKEVIVKILKIDTEGYDEKVLEGARKALQRVHYCIVETNNEKTRELLRQLGFDCKTMRPSGYLLATRTIGTDQFRNCKTRDSR